MKNNYPEQSPYLLVSDSEGNIFENKSCYVTGRVGFGNSHIPKEEFIELPEGSELFYLPGRKPVGINIKTGLPEVVNNCLAVAAFVAPAYTIKYHACWETMPGAPGLPLFAYSAAGWVKNKFWVPALRIDNEIRQDCNQFNQKKVIAGITFYKNKFRNNRLIEHLSYCAKVYYCPAARNFFLRRWEAPLPTSPSCNAQCLGCISYQPKEAGIVSTQNRITFIPLPEEIAEIAVEHLENAPEPVVSFGQGCEGEPLLVWETICEAIKIIRRKTKNGVINLNTNAGNPHAVEQLCKAGLQSIRISINSFNKETYTSYFRPRNYSFDDVIESFYIARRNNIWKSVNYFVFPGITDRQGEYELLKKSVIDYGINMIQWRNFNIDPEWYLHEVIKSTGEKTLGIVQEINLLRKEFPGLAHGYFNPGLAVINKYLNIESGKYKDNNR